MTKTFPRFHVVDVFAERRYAGNPLAVVLGCDDLDDATMQSIAAETNYSETTFVVPAPEPDGGWRVRLFTPARELDFAGHPILGTAWVIRRYLANEADVMQLNLPRARVEVKFEQDGHSETLWFRAPPVEAGAICAREPMAAALGLAVADIDERAPIRRYAAGTAAMVVPLRSLDALRRSRLDLDAYAPLLAAGLPPLIYQCCTETRAAGNDLSARFFFEAHGVREDPATGNGAAFLGAWLLAHRWLGEGDLDLRIEQGHEVRRPSLVRLRARRTPAGDEIFVGGRVIPAFVGELA